MNLRTCFFTVGTVLMSAAMAHAQPSARGAEQGAAAGHHHGQHDSHAAAADLDNPVTRAYREVNDKMHADMAIQFTGDADVDFMHGMIPHHQGAIDMARVVLQHGTDPQVRELAEAVIAAQEDEIAMMRKWLSERGR